MLSLARPAALWIGLALVPIVALYFLRMRFRRKSVGSTYLWRRLAEATAGGDALRRRSILLLILQAAAVVLAALAASGPFLVSRSLIRPGIVFVIDVSASMGTRDCPGPRGTRSASRVDAAVEAVSKEIDALSEGVPVMAFACSVTARPLLRAPTQDKAAAKASLRGLAADSGAFEEGPCSDAISGWLSRTEGSWGARAFTDGGMDLGGERLASAFGEAGGEAGGGAFGSVILGTSRESLGITGFRLVDGMGGKARAAFSLWNGHAEAEELRLRLTRGKVVLASGFVRADPGWSRGSLDLETGIEDGGYELKLERRSGDLEGGAGDASYLSVATRRATAVLLVGRSDPFLKAALAQDGIVYSSLAEFPVSLAGDAAGKASGGESAPDIVIVESSPVPAGVHCNLLVFGAPPPDAPIAPSGAAAGPIASAAGNSPLSRFVSWEGAQASSGLAYALRGQALVIATTGGKPSIVAWESGGYRCLAVGIDLARSDLGLKSAFPVLLQNYFQWCAPRVDDQSAFTLSVGESARRIAPGSFKIKGDGAAAARSGPAVIIDALKPGLFEWEAGGDRGFLAVNVPSSEIDASPRSLRAGSSAGGETLAAEERESSKSLGALAAALFALCLAAEWIAWSGRSARPGPKPGKAARGGGGK